MGTFAAIVVREIDRKSRRYIARLHGKIAVDTTPSMQKDVKPRCEP
ncbi:hypothetical protein [Bradyrhizobium sp. Tv2a-2]|nr:hypothetical protein [Bradyrhizobium sp. Tv2a-2]